MEAMMKLKESLFGKAKNNINSAQDRYKKDYNRKRKLCQEFEIGSHVLLRNSKRDSKKGDKMVPKWSGPYEIIELKDEKLARLRNLKQKLTLQT